MAEEEDNQISQLIAYNQNADVKLIKLGAKAIQPQITLSFPNNQTTIQNLLQILYDGDTKEYMDQDVQSISIIIPKNVVFNETSFNGLAYVLSKYYNSRFRDDTYAFDNILPPKYKNNTYKNEQGPIILLVNFSMINANDISKSLTIKNKLNNGITEDNKEEIEFEDIDKEDFGDFVDKVGGIDYQSRKKIKDRYKKFVQEEEELDEQGEQTEAEPEEEEPVVVKKTKIRKRKSKRKRFTKRKGKGIDFDKYKVHLVNLTSYTGDNKIYTLGTRIKDNIDYLKHYGAYRN